MIVAQFGESFTDNEDFDTGKSKRKEYGFNPDSPAFASSAGSAESDVFMGIFKEFSLFGVRCAE